jgi:hypothetical protein
MAGSNFLVMENKKDGNQFGNNPQNAGENHDPDQELDFDSNPGGSFAYPENQENESIYTLPDDSLNPAVRGSEGPADDQHPGNSR